MSLTETRQSRELAARQQSANDACPHVLRAINAVSAKLAEDGISKSRNNQQQGYKFRGIDEVLNALASLLGEQRLIIVPHIRSRELTERTSSKGGALFSVVVTADYTFVSAEDGSTHEVGPFYGEAMDSADKATNKAMSAAYKYMAIQTFCIPTEGDNDADATTHEVAPRRSPTARPIPDAQSPQDGGEKGAAVHPTRRVNLVENPNTGRTIDTENARNQRPEWAKFTDSVQGFVDARDSDGLKAWFASDKIAAYVAGWVFKDEAHEHFEAALDRIAELERA